MTESLPSETSTLPLTPASTSSLPSTPLFKSHVQTLSGMTPPANSDTLDPMFCLVWPHPQVTTQMKGPRFFPTSVLPILIFRELKSGEVTSKSQCSSSFCSGLLFCLFVCVCVLSELWIVQWINNVVAKPFTS